MEAYSIFSDTIADMTWPAVEEAASRHVPILVPVAVIEQHGPHLPLGTDTYGAHLLCSLVRRELAAMGIECVVAPPFYYGMNLTTGMFPGSLSISSGTMRAVLQETIQNYARWGFAKQLIINHHGDPEHNRAIVETIKALRAQGIGATYVVGGIVQEFIDTAYEAVFHRRLPLEGDEIIRAVDSPATIAARASLTRSSLSFDVHAGERETSMIMRWYPELLGKETDIGELRPVPDSIRAFQEAESTGRWRELSPLGYIGDPAAAGPDNGELYSLEAADIAAAIASSIRS
ncbi:MAG: creatininase family protein [Actinobacteria bacterium]|nr:creatininase family protein [Actinomycetota bacterium]